MRRYWLAALLLMGLCRPAAAVPPEKVIRMEAGGDRFEKGYRGDWIAMSLQPDQVEAQAFETDEVHLTAKKAGRCMVLLYNTVLRQVAIWRVDVDLPPEAADPKPVKKACGCDPGQRPLGCRLASGACIDALRGYLDAAGLTAEQLRLNYTVEGLQAMAKKLDARISAAGFTGIQVAFVGANLRLQGRVADRKAWARLVMLVYEGFVGRLILDDHLTIESSPDAGP